MRDTVLQVAACVRSSAAWPNISKGSTDAIVAASPLAKGGVRARQIEGLEVRPGTIDVLFKPAVPSLVVSVVVSVVASIIISILSAATIMIVATVVVSAIVSVSVSVTVPIAVMRSLGGWGRGRRWHHAGVSDARHAAGVPNRRRYPGLQLAAGPWSLHAGTHEGECLAGWVFDTGTLTNHRIGLGQIEMLKVSAGTIHVLFEGKAWKSRGRGR